MNPEIEGCPTADRPFRLGEWLVEPRLNRLTRDGESIQIELKMMDVLVCLAEQAGELVERQQLIDTVWATEFITEKTLTRAVAELRRTLGDDAKEPKYIETIHRKGYRLIVPVEIVRSPPATVTRFPAPSSGRDDNRSPYPGLAAFTEDDAEFFFGRESEVAQLWRKITARRLLAVIGPSGVGKSSFLRAGLIPSAPEGWGILVCHPGEAPFEELARALVPEFKEDPGALSKLVGFRANPLHIFSRWREHHDRVVLIVDQFEELFTLNPPPVQSQFADLLGLLARDADVHVLLAMRDDFLYRCHAHPPLRPILGDLTALAQPDSVALERALVQPAQRLGFTFDDHVLTAEMIAEVEGERGALPMLAFALDRLWGKRDRNQKQLTRQAYDDIGGVGGALARHAEAILQTIGNNRVSIVRELFRNLVTAQGTRATREANELLSVFDDPETAREALAVLIDARLLTSFEVTTEDGEARRTVEIVHESLLDAWPRLVRWQTQDADAAQLRDEIRQAARTWDEHGRTDDMLWTGSTYREFAVWRERYPGGLTGLEEAFTEAMRVHAGRRKRRRLFAVASIIAALLIVLGIVATSRQKALTEARRAEASKLVALGRIELPSNPSQACPSSALAFAIASLELSDTLEARELALATLWAGPTAIQMASATYYAMPFTTSGDWLAQITAEGELNAWPRDDAEPTVLPFKLWPAGVLMLRPGPTGDLVAVWSVNPSRLEMWSISEGTRIDRVDFESPVRVTSSQDGQLLVFQDVGSSADARRWVADGASWPALGKIHREYWADEANLGIPRVSVGGNWAATFSGTATWLHDLDHLDHPARRLAGHVVEVTAVAVSVDGTMVASSDKQSTVLIHSLDGPQDSPPRTLQGPARISRLAFDLPGNRLAAASMADGTAWMWNLQGPPDAAPVVFHRKNTSQVMRVQFDPAGRWLATSGTPTSVQLWPLSDRQPYILAEGLGIIWDLDFLPDGNHLATVLDGGSIRLWPLSPEASPHHRILFQSPTTHLSDLAVDPLGRFLAVSGGDGTFLVPLNGDPARELEGFTSGAFCVACSPDGRYVAAGGGHSDPTEQVLRIWDLVNGDIQVLGSDDERGSGGFIRIQFTPDGQRLFTSGFSGVRTWSLEDGSSEYLGEGLTAHLSDNGEFLYAATSDLQTFGRANVYDLKSGYAQQLTPHDRATFISSSSDGATVVSGGLDGVIRVGPKTGDQPHLLYGHKGWVNPVVSPDGRWIASGGEDGSLRLWPMPDLSKPPLHTLPPDELIAKLKTLTNLRVVRDEDSPAGWKVEVGPFPGWETVPTW